jgi:hypothetical protein
MPLRPAHLFNSSVYIDRYLLILFLNYIRCNLTKQ